MLSNIKTIDTILYVEDEKNVQEELASVLEMFCDNLYLASNGMEGLEQFKKYSPSIIVTDIKMPLMNGIDMCKKIKELNPDQKVIFTTAFSDIKFFQQAIELQVEGYVIKPVDLQLLESKILKVIEHIELQKDLFKKEQLLIQQSKLASMGEMIRNIAHQWKQPLAAISMVSNNLRVDCEFDSIKKESLLDYSKEINSQVQYLAQTIDDFRDFFKQSQNSEKVINIKDFIDKCVDLIKASFDDNMIYTIKEIDDKIEAYGDSNQLSQVLINILNNARDALKEAEDIQEKLVFLISTKQDENNLIITIKDNAGGIPESIIDKVFDPYFTTKGPSRGTGLGLYISHTIITENLNGSISVENEEFEYDNVKYKGAKFTMVLPLKE